MYSSGGAHGDTAELQQYIEPLLHKYNVQVGAVCRRDLWPATSILHRHFHAAAYQIVLTRGWHIGSLPAKHWLACLQAYFSGHDHHLEHLRVPKQHDVDYIISGAGSQVRLLC